MNVPLSIRRAGRTPQLLVPCEEVLGILIHERPAYRRSKGMKHPFDTLFARQPLLPQPGNVSRIAQHR